MPTSNTIISLNAFSIAAMLWVPTALSSAQIPSSLNITKLAMLQTEQLSDRYLRPVSLALPNGQQDIDAVVYGHPSIGFVQTSKFEVSQSTLKVDIWPVSYTYPTEIYMKREGSRWIHIGQRRWPNPTPSYIQTQITTKRTGKNPMGLFATHVALPQVLGRPAQEQSSTWGFDATSEIWVSVIVNQDGEVIFSQWPDGYRRATKQPPMMSRDGNGNMFYGRHHKKKKIGVLGHNAQAISTMLPTHMGVPIHWLKWDKQEPTMVITRTQFWFKPLSSFFGRPQKYASYAIWKKPSDADSWRAIWRPESWQDPARLIERTADSNLRISAAPDQEDSSATDYTGPLDVDCLNDGYWAFTVPLQNSIYLVRNHSFSKPLAITTWTLPDRTSTTGNKSLSFPTSTRFGGSGLLGIVERGQKQSLASIGRINSHNQLVPVGSPIRGSEKEQASWGSWILPRDDQHAWLHWRMESQPTSTTIQQISLANDRVIGSLTFMSQHGIDHQINPLKDFGFHQWVEKANWLNDDI